MLFMTDVFLCIQVLWLQRVKELKVQCEQLREEATIAANNSVSASLEFSQGAFAQRILQSLSHLIAFAQGSDVDIEGGWVVNEILGVGNAVVGDKLRHLMGALQRLKASETSLHRRSNDLSQGNQAVAGLQARVHELERELGVKRKAVETLSLQLDMENTPSKAAAGTGGMGDIGGVGMHQVAVCSLVCLFVCLWGYRRGRQAQYTVARLFVLRI